MKHRAFHIVLLSPVAAILLMVVTLSGQYYPESERNHENAVCRDCHTLLAGPAGAKPVDRSETCLECHEPTTFAESMLPFHNNSNRACLDCHDFHQKELITTRSNQFAFDFDNNQTKSLCISCHETSTQPALISPGHEKALEIYHSSSLQHYKLSPSESCLLCHSGGGYIYKELSAVQTVPRFSEHASHPVGVYAQLNHSDEDKTGQKTPAARLINGRLECQSCHDINSESKNLLVGGDNSYEFCFSCHQDKRYRVNQFSTKF